MAVDTRDKRSSAIYTLIPYRGQFPNPDGALDQADRQHVALVYRGILAASSQPGLGGVFYTRVIRAAGEMQSIVISGAKP